MKDKIKKYIEKNYDYNTPILTSEIKELFPDVKDGTIRQILRRLKEDSFLEQTGPGTFFKPKKMGVLKKAYITTEQVTRKKYLYDESNIVGYITGFNFANELSLTTQTSHVMQLVSNKVSDKKRRIKIGNRSIIVESPRVQVTNSNYKLLQILDLLTSFEKYSELDLYEAKPKILNYLSKLNLSIEELDMIVSKYPIRAQLKFYKLGDINEITLK